MWPHTWCPTGSSALSLGDPSRQEAAVAFLSHETSQEPAHLPFCTAEGKAI